MARDRIESCVHYICLGSCKKNKKAEHKGICQTCDKYYPRARRKHPNEKKAKIEKERMKIFD